MLSPFKYESGIPVFYKSDCEIFGFPDYHGYDMYEVVEDIPHPLVHDYTSQLERRLRPIHRYSRVDRFTFILAQMLGLRGDVDDYTIAICKGSTCWDDVRIALKNNGLCRLYNRIPLIMKILKLPPPITVVVTQELLGKIVDDFKTCQNNFKTINFFTARKYFPSLKFVAYKLLERHGAEFDKSINFIRTHHKLVELENLWKWIS